MTGPSIFVASPDADQYLPLLQEQLGADIGITIACSLQEAERGYDKQPVLLARPDYAAAILKTGAPVQWVQSTWAGVTPLVRLPARDYQLTGVKGVFGPQMAEYVFGYILAHELRIRQRQASQQQGQWDNSPSARLQGKTLGVMGTGSIGREVARVGLEFGLRPVGLNRDGTGTGPFTEVFPTASLYSFLGQCDYVVGVLPDVPATTDLIDAKALAAMTDSALLINVGRGNLIDEDALYQALQTGQIAAAVLDVFKQEPLPESSPLWRAPNCHLTGHVAAVSHPEDIAGIFIDNYSRFAAGAPLLHLVDFEKGY